MKTQDALWMIVTFSKACLVSGRSFYVHLPFNGEHSLHWSRLVLCYHGNVAQAEVNQVHKTKPQILP